MILTAIIALPLIFFIPGYVTFTAFKVNEIDNLKLSLLETLFLYVLVNIVITGWIAFVLAELGIFSLWILIGVLAVYSTILALKFRIKFSLYSLPKPKLNLESLILILIVIMAAGIFFHPSEYVVRGNMDANAYLGMGVDLAKTGSIIVHEPYAGFPKPILEYIIPFRQYSYVGDNEVDFQPPFLHLYPTWIAIFYSIFDLRTSLYITPLFGLLGILSIFLFSKRLFNNEVALISAVLLGLNFAQICWSRTPFPEILGQFLFLSGAYTFLMFRRSDHPFFSILSGVCIGELLLTRLEFIYIIIPIIFYLGFTNYNPKSKLYCTFLVPIILLLIHSLIHNFTISQSYVSTLVQRESYEVFKVLPSLFNIMFSQNFVPDINWYIKYLDHPATSFISVYFLIGIVIILGVFILTLDNVRIFRDARENKKVTSTLRHLFVLLFMAFLIYNYFIRPQYFQPPPGQPLFNYRGGGFDAITLIRLTYFLTPLGLFMGALALVALTYRKNKPGIGLFIFTGLFYFIYFTNHTPISPPLPFWSRKFISIIIPFLVVLIAYAIYYIKLKLPNKKIIVPVLILYLVTSLIIISYPLIGYTEYKGAIDNMQNFADNFGEDDFIIFHHDQGGILFARPLWFLFDKKAIVLQNLDPDKFEEMLKQQSNETRKFYFIRYQDHRLIDKLSNRDHIEVLLKRRITMKYPQLEYTYLDLNTHSRNMTYHLNIYEVRYQK